MVALEEKSEAHKVSKVDNKKIPNFMAIDSVVESSFKPKWFNNQQTDTAIPRDLVKK